MEIIGDNKLGTLIYNEIWYFLKGQVTKSKIVYRCHRKKEGERKKCHREIEKYRRRKEKEIYTYNRLSSYLSRVTVSWYLGPMVVICVSMLAWHEKDPNRYPARLYFILVAIISIVLLYRSLSTFQLCLFLIARFNVR